MELVLCSGLGQVPGLGLGCLLCLDVTLGLYSPALHSWLALDHGKGNLFNEVPKDSPAINHSPAGAMSPNSGSSVAVMAGQSCGTSSCPNIKEWAVTATVNLKPLFGGRY